MCEDGKSVGGQGGNSFPTYATDGINGQPEPLPNPSGAGLGGAGDDGTGCIAGEHGIKGTSGEHGKGGSSSGRITQQGWEG